MQMPRRSLQCARKIFQNHFSDGFDARLFEARSYWAQIKRRADTAPAMARAWATSTRPNKNYSRVKSFEEDRYRFCEPFTSVAGRLADEG